MRAHMYAVAVALVAGVRCAVAQQQCCGSLLVQGASRDQPTRMGYFEADGNAYNGYPTYRNQAGQTLFLTNLTTPPSWYIGRSAGTLTIAVRSSTQGMPGCPNAASGWQAFTGNGATGFENELVTVTCATRPTCSCNSVRVWIRNVSDTSPRSTAGWYARTNSTYAGFPTYTNPSGQVLFYSPQGAAWYISATVGSTATFASAQSGVEGCVTDAFNWTFADGAAAAVECQERPTCGCQSINLNTGFGTSYAGYFTLIPGETRGGWPVYNNSAGRYLYFNPNNVAWWVGTSIGSLSVAIRSLANLNNNNCVQDVPGWESFRSSGWVTGGTASCQARPTCCRSIQLAGGSPQPMGVYEIDGVSGGWPYYTDHFGNYIYYLPSAAGWHGSHILASNSVGIRSSSQPEVCPTQATGWQYYTGTWDAGLVVTCDSTYAPTSQPTNGPTTQPTTSPPTRAPTVAPTVNPSVSPTQSPSVSLPTINPSSSSPTSPPSSSLPTRSPSAAPISSSPSAVPSSSIPTLAPTTLAPTAFPSKAPTTRSPTDRFQTFAPTGRPSTSHPSVRPTISPTTPTPTVSPSTTLPTLSPTSTQPTVSPATSTPTASPASRAPSAAPFTSMPSNAPTISPSGSPSSTHPTASPSSSFPTAIPTSTPTRPPSTRGPTLPGETFSPTIHPTGAPSFTPSKSPTDSPATPVPTREPSTSNPTTIPTASTTQPGTVDLTGCTLDPIRNVITCVRPPPTGPGTFLPSTDGSDDHTTLIIVIILVILVIIGMVCAILFCLWMQERRKSADAMSGSRSGGSSTLMPNPTFDSSTVASGAARCTNCKAKLAFCVCTDEERIDRRKSNAAAPSLGPGAVGRSDPEYDVVHPSAIQNGPVYDQMGNYEYDAPVDETKWSKPHNSMKGRPPAPPPGTVGPTPVSAVPTQPRPQLRAAPAAITSEGLYDVAYDPNAAGGEVSDFRRRTDSFA